MNVRILCVEDSAEERELLQEVLRQYDVTCASTAYEARSEIERGPFDLYVLDHWPPDLNGLQLCEDIRRRDPRVPIVFCTAGRMCDRAEAMRAGANAYFCKPYGAATLMREIRVLVEVADLESRRAWAEEERAITAELHEFAQRLKSRTDVERDRASSALETTARARALRAFVEKGGTLSNFDRWWPRTYREHVAEASLALAAARSDPGSSA